MSPMRQDHPLLVIQRAGYRCEVDVRGRLCPRPAGATLTVDGKTIAVCLKHRDHR